MQKFPQKLALKLQERTENKALRSLGKSKASVDFASNDYLGFAQSATIFQQSSAILKRHGCCNNGATGSRLLSGNYPLLVQAETALADFHQADSALLFNSGYTANLGFFACVPQRGDVVFYDELIHASIRDGLQMGFAKTYKFRHNNWESIRLDLLHKNFSGEVYVVTESVFSMDGDSPDLTTLATFCAQHHFHLVVDEAHAIGVFGSKGQGLVQELALQPKIFARIITFGKALGGHGAAILGSPILKTYLLNFARPFIYSTAMSPHSAATILAGYAELNAGNSTEELHEKILCFRKELKKHGLEKRFIPSVSAIQSCEIPGNEAVKKAAKTLQNKGFDVKPILSPTVPQGKERLRFCLHTYNSTDDIRKILKELATFVH